MRARRAKRIEKQKIIKVLGDNDDDSVVPVREESASKEKNDSIAKQLSTIFNRHTLTSLKTALSFVNRQILSIKLKLNTHTARHGSLKREMWRCRPYNKGNFCPVWKYVSLSWSIRRTDDKKGN